MADPTHVDSLIVSLVGDVQQFVDSVQEAANESVAAVQTIDAQTKALTRSQVQAVSTVITTAEAAASSLKSFQATLGKTQAPVSNLSNYTDALKEAENQAQLSMQAEEEIGEAYQMSGQDLYALARARKEATRITKQLQTAEEKFLTSLERAKQLKEANLISTETYNRREQQLKETLKKSGEEYKNQGKRQEALLRVRKQVAKIVRANRTAEENYAAIVRRANALVTSGLMTQQERTRWLEREAQKLPKVIAANQKRAEQQRETNRLAKEASRLTASVMTSEEKYAAVVTKVDKMLAASLITKQTHTRLLEREKATQLKASQATTAQSSAQRYLNQLSKEAKAIVAGTQTAYEKYAIALHRTSQMVAKGLITEKQRAAHLDALRAKIPAVARQQEIYNRMVQDAANRTRNASSSSEKYAVEVQKLRTLMANGLISATTYRRSIRNLNKEFARSPILLKKTAQGLKTLGFRLRGIGSRFNFSATLPIAGLSFGLTKAASDAEEARQKFRFVFRDVIDNASKSAKALVDNFGVSVTESLERLSSTGDILTGFGFDQKTALGMSNSVNALAADLVAFTNYQGGVAQASQALTRAMLGEREAVKSLGMAITEKGVQDQVALNQSKGITHATEEQAKAFAVLQIAQRQSKNAIGAFNRERQSFANQTRELIADVKDLAMSYGEILLPVGKKVISFIRSGIKWFDSFSKKQKEMVLKFGGITALIGPIATGFGVLAAVTAPVIAALGTIGSIGIPTLAVIGAKAAAVAAAVGVAATAAGALAVKLIGYDRIKQTFVDVLEAVQTFSVGSIGFLANFQDNVDRVSKWFKETWKASLRTVTNFVLGFSDAWVNNSKLVFRTTSRLWTAFLGSIAVKIKNFMVSDFPTMWIDGFEKVVKIAEASAEKIGEAIKLGLTTTLYGSWFKERSGLSTFFKRLKDDFVAGTSDAGFADVASRIIEQELKNLKNPFTNFKAVNAFPELNLDMGGGAAVDRFKDLNKQVEVLDANQQKAAESGMLLSKSQQRIAKSVEEARQKFQAQIDAFAGNSRAVQIQKLAQKGATEEQLKSIKALVKELDALEANKKAQEAAKDIMDKHKSSTTKLIEKQKQLKAMWSSGHLTLEVYNKEMAELTKELNKEVTVNVRVKGIEPAIAGTREALATLMDFASRNFENDSKFKVPKPAGTNPTPVATTPGTKTKKTTTKPVKMGDTGIEIPKPMMEEGAGNVNIDLSNIGLKAEKFDVPGVKFNSSTSTDFSPVSKTKEPIPVEPVTRFDKETVKEHVSSVDTDLLKAVTEMNTLLTSIRDSNTAIADTDFAVIEPANV